MTALPPSPEFLALFGEKPATTSCTIRCGVAPAVGMPAPVGYVASAGDLWKNDRTGHVILALGGATRRRRPTSGLHYVNFYSHGMKATLWGMHCRTNVEYGGPIENALIGWDCESWLYCGSIFDRVPYDSL